MRIRWIAGMMLAGIIGVEAAAESPERQPGEDARAPTGLEIDISEREMYLYQEGKLVNTYTVAVGQPEYPTPKVSSR